MQSHDSVDNMVRDYSRKAIEKAQSLNAELDYSENSLMEVEVILGRLADSISGGGPNEDVTETCKVWGCYLGEVVRRRFGGEWGIETYPGKQFATLTLNIAGNKLFPSMKVHRRLTEGEGDNVWSFYKMIKTRLEKAQTPPVRTQ
ncbi:MAG TPA: hypothetical protein VKZ53_05240 [Candidatus Angelobacter sp.]|nr:hypothetical protein [Candidatus Angelobacter sp.]